MAKVRKRPAGSSQVSSIIPGKIASLLREVGLILLFAVVGYLFVCLLTYSPADPGPTHTDTGKEIVNMGGKVGAWIADLLYTGFGRMSYLFLGLLCITGWKAYKDRGPEKQNGWNYILPVVGFITAMIGACGLEQVYFPIRSPETIFHAGGIVGPTARPRRWRRQGGCGRGHRGRRNR